MYHMIAVCIPFPVIGMASLFVASSAFQVVKESATLEQIAVQSPFVAGMLMVFWWFLKHIEKKDERMAEVIDKNTEALKDLTVAVKTKHE